MTPSRESRIVLKDAKNRIELRILSGRRAEVVRGTLWARGDWVECPSWIEWEEATELTQEGHTVLPPGQVRLVYDALGDAFVFSDDAVSPVPERIRAFRRMPAAPEDVEPFVWEIYVATAERRPSGRFYKSG